MKNKIIVISLLVVLALAVFIFINKKDIAGRLKISSADTKINIIKEEDLAESNRTLENLAKELAFCKVDADCAAVPVSACSCEEGGQMRAIHKDQKTAFLNKIPRLQGLPCPGWNACPVDEKPLCHNKQCYLNRQAMLSELIAAQDVEAYKNALQIPENITPEAAEALWTPIILSNFSQEDKISLLSFLTEKGVKTTFSWYGWLLDNDQFEVADYLLHNSTMERTVPASFFTEHDLQPSKTDQSAIETKRMLFPLQHGFSLTCEEGCLTFLNNTKQTTKNKERSKLFLMAFGAIAKEPVTSKNIMYEIENCTDATHPCQVVKLAYELVNTPKAATANPDVDKKKTQTLLNKYNVCRRAEDCEPLTFGSCDDTLAAVSINKNARGAVLLDTALIQQMRALFARGILRNWCPVELPATTQDYSVTCEKRKCVLHPQKPVNIAIL